MSENVGDLDALVQAARRPVKPCRLPPAPLRIRLGTSPWLRRALPTRLAVARAEARGRALWDRAPEERDRARAAMDAVVAATPRAHEVQALAREHVIEARVKETLFWQPWSAPQLDAGSRGRLGQALACGRGILLSSCHTGPYHLGVSALAAEGRTVFSAVAWAMDSPQPGYWGRRVAHRRTQASLRNERLLRAGGSFALMQRLLAAGEVVSVFFSMPGSRETPFLGKPVMLPTGSSRLALASDAIILPVRSRRARHSMHLDVAHPLDPRGFGACDEMHRALAAVHEQWLLENPAAIDDPNREGAWERGATATGWRRGRSDGGAAAQ